MRKDSDCENIMQHRKRRCVMNDYGKISEMVEAASGRRKAELVIKNAHIVNVFSSSVVFSSLAVHRGVIVGIGSYEGEREIDAEGRYILPGLIDSHVHIESSLLSPERFAEMVIPQGTTTVIADPHEIANVCGREGIQYILSAAEKLPLNVSVMIPSCVPAAEFEHSGAAITSRDVRDLMKRKSVLGLGEMMDYNGAAKGRKEVLEKIAAAREFGKKIDGHAPMMEGKALTAYAAAGVKTDHECSTVDEMQERISRGMYVLLREGSAAKNLGDLLRGVNVSNSRRCLFCTDDRQPSDILSRGHISSHLRIAAAQGIDPVTAVQMASLNAAECYGLTGKGALAPGYDADFIIADDLQNFNISSVYIQGVKRAENGRILEKLKQQSYASVSNTIHTASLGKADFALHIPGTDIVKVIRISPGSLITEKVNRKINKDVNGCFAYHEHLDILKTAVVERHHQTGNIGLGLVENYKLRGGAVATSIAHDSHNIIVIGDSDDDILCAVNEVIRIQGGIAVCRRGEILDSLALPIAGLMSPDSPETVMRKLSEMEELAYRELHVNREIDPFMTLSFLALPVIPELKLTDRGLFDVNTSSFIDVNA